MEMKCSLRSNSPRDCQCPSRSSVGLTSIRKYKYKMAPSSAEIKYKTTMALANDAEGPKEGTWSAANWSKCRQRLVSDRAKQRNCHETMNHQQRDRHLRPLRMTASWSRSECTAGGFRAMRQATVARPLIAERGRPSCSVRTPPRSRMALPPKVGSD